MILPSDYHSSNQQQSQADPLSLLPSLLILEDPTAFLNKYVEALQLMREIQKEQAQARREAEAEKLSQAKIEAEKCNRLIAIVLKHAEGKGISPSDLPNLKRKSYSELCAYINEYWLELSDRI
ncbi:MAG: hypothetical protein ACM37W_10535 [Actinomycetota bacterium]